MKRYEEIHASYVNGQFEQMIRQIEEVRSLYNFAILLERIKEDFDDKSALDIAIKYCKMGKNIKSQSPRQTKILFDTKNGEQKNEKCKTSKLPQLSYEI